MRAHPTHPVWQEIAPEITPGELRHPYRMNVSTLRRLSRVRRRSGVPFRFVSDYRTPVSNAAAGGATDSAHMDDPGCAVDLRILSSRERFRLLTAALAEGYTRIGCYPPTDHQRRTWGKNSGSVHLDDSPTRPQEVIWVSP
jgi:uncharacterized protein YcbK (DUF882 family)